MVGALLERMPDLPSQTMQAELAISQEPVPPPQVSPLCDLPRILPPQPPPRRRPYRLGRALWDEDIEFLYSPTYNDVHAAVFGESGSGKSKLLELLARRLLQDGEGVMIVDPDKDLIDDLLGFVAYRCKIGDRQLIRRCHVLTIEQDLAFRFDPFALLPCRGSLSREEYDSRLRALVDRLIRQIQRGISDEDLLVMNRLKKRLRAVLMACGVDYDGKGSHLGMGKATILANPADPEFRPLLDQVYPHLPRSAQMTFLEVMGHKVSASTLDHWESTQNRLDDFLSPLTALCLGVGPSVDFAKGIANREVFFVRIGQNLSVSHDMAMTMAGFLLDAYLQVKEGEEDRPPHLRTPATLIVDEAGEFIGPDLCRALRRDRKLKLSIILGAQNYMTLCNSNLAMGDYVLSQCGTVFCFAQRLGKAGREIVADRLFTGNLSFTPRQIEIQMQRGWLQTRSFDASISGNTTRTWNQTQGRGSSETESKQKSRQHGTVQSWAFTDGEGESTNNTDGRSRGESNNGSQSMTLSPQIRDGIVVNCIPVFNTSQGNGRSEQESHSVSFGLTRNHSTTEGFSQTEVRGSGTGHAISLSHNSSEGEGGSDGEGWTLSMKTGLIPNIVSEWRWDGGFEEGSSADQREIFQKWLHSLNTAECFVSVRGFPQAFPVKIDHVEEKWPNPAIKWATIRFITRKIAAQHDYTFSPNKTPNESLVVEPPAVPQQPESAGGFND